jgi:hypothetical protein
MLLTAERNILLLYSSAKGILLLPFHGNTEHPYLLAATCRSKMNAKAVF